MLTPAQRQALSVIGAIGGRKSRRKLTQEEASRMGKLGGRPRKAALCKDGGKQKNSSK